MILACGVPHDTVRAAGLQVLDEGFDVKKKRPPEWVVIELSDEGFD